jgi:glutamate--cysteine ligase
MSLDLGAQSASISSVDELVNYIRGAERPREQWLVGVEHEKIGVCLPSLRPVGYYGQCGIRSLLDDIARSAGGAQHKHAENGMPIALLSENASVTLEPGGQLELSGAPSRSFAAIEKEIADHLAEVKKDSRGIAWLAAGYRPFGKREDVEWMPKGRYAAMRASLGPRGRLALDMMLMTATVQANLDWSDEQDLATKVRCSTAVSPIVTAMFANSPLIDGKPSGYLDFRYQVWRETDPARCGLLKEMFEPGWTYRKYVEWALDVPMLFIRHGKEYTDAKQQTFRDWFTTGKISDGTKVQPQLQNWVDHLTTLFPEVRVKRVLELRGQDVVPPPLMMSLPAIWLGLLYDRQSALDATSLTAKWKFAELVEFQGEVARHALTARGPDGRTARELAREVLDIARRGLKRVMPDGEKHLDPLSDIVESGKTLAERALDAIDASNGDPRAAVPIWQIA